jgi:hypothetical protein
VGAVIERSLAVRELRGELAAATVALDAQATARAQCEQRERDLGQANARLADTLKRQTESFDQWAAATAAAQQAGNAAAREALRAAADDRAKAAWLADLLRRNDAAPGCAEALRLVREGLR